MQEGIEGSIKLYKLLSSVQGRPQQSLLVGDKVQVTMFNRYTTLQYPDHVRTSPRKSLLSQRESQKSLLLQLEVIEREAACLHQDHHLQLASLVKAIQTERLFLAKGFKTCKWKYSAATLPLQPS